MILLGLASVLGVIYLILKTLANRRAMKSAIKVFNSFQIDEGFREQFQAQFCYLNERSAWHMDNHTMFQTVGKCSEILAITLSVCTLAFLFEEYNTIHPFIISIVSIIFVIISIYITPIDRAREYILGWRVIDKHINTILSTNPITDAEKFKEHFIRIPEVLSKAEELLRAKER